jgi:hypothetical protein
MNKEKGSFITRLRKMKKLPEWVKVVLVLTGIPYGIFLGWYVTQILDQLHGGTLWKE